MKDLFNVLHRKFNDNIVREILLVASGVKDSRTCMSTEELIYFIPIAETHNIEVAISHNKYIHRPDIGKGGWSNSLEKTVSANHPTGLHNVYLSRSRKSAKEGLLAEENSDEETFGGLLGIPACCRNAYLKSHYLAKQKQNDFVPLVLLETDGGPPYNYWNNYVSQYFGRALLSFFPCSFNCPEAASFAEKSFQVLSEVSEGWAFQFVIDQQSNILYTEYDGLFRFNSTFNNGWINYSPSEFVATTQGKLTDQMQQANRIKILHKNGVEIYANEQLIARHEHEDISMCIFHSNSSQK